MKQILLVLSFALLAGCSSFPERAVSGKYLVKEPSAYVFSYLKDRTKECWERKWGWFYDGVKIKTHSSSEGHLIQAHRFSLDIGVKPPFVQLFVADYGPDASEVTLIEGGEYNFLTKTSFEPEIHQWLNGNATCITQK